MKRRLLVALGILVLIMAPAGCNGTPTPPVDRLTHLEQLVVSGQSIEQVKGLMTPRLQLMAAFYPANLIQQKASGNWNFKAKEGGSQGDTDAPYVAMVVTPDAEGEQAYAVFFKDGSVIGDAWFSNEGANMIRKALTNQLEEQS